MLKVAVLLLALVACASAQVTLTPLAGGKTNYEIVWVADDTVVYPDQEFTVGDQVTFTWQSQHDVARTPFTAGADPCATIDTPAATILSPAAPSGTFTYTFAATDTAAMAFFCTVGLHCSDKGQKITFRPASAAGAPPPATTTPPPASPSGGPAPIISINISPFNLIPPIAPISLPTGSITIPGTNITVGIGNSNNRTNSTTGGNSAAGGASAATAVMAAGLLLAAALVA